MGEAAVARRDGSTVEEPSLSPVPERGKDRLQRDPGGNTQRDGEHPPSYLPQLHNRLSGTRGGDPLAKEEADLFAPHGCALPARAWDTHRFAKLQRTPVSRLDSARHVSAGSLVPSKAPGAQEGLKGHWQRGDREAKGHAASSVQGESTKHGYGRPTSLDLCPCPVATAGCVLIQIGDEDEYSAPETRIPAAWCLL